MFMYDYVIVSQSTMRGISLKWISEGWSSISIDELNGCWWIYLQLDSCE